MSITSFNNFLLLKFILTLIRLEWGSVQMNPASTSFTLFNALSLRKHSPNNSLDSSAHDIHSNGGCRYRSQLRQNCNVPCLGMSCVMSTWVRRHDTHMLAGFDDMVTPHWQHNLNEQKRMNIRLVLYMTKQNVCSTIRTFWQLSSQSRVACSPFRKILKLCLKTIHYVRKWRR